MTTTTKTGSTATDNQFESSEGTSASSGAKYAEIEVPNFLFDDNTSNTVSTATTATTASFLRLGSFPSTSDASTYPSGFVHSLALAKLVGDTSRYVSPDGTSTGADAFMSATDAPGASGAGTETNPYGGDAAYLVGFADDTRHRKDEDTANLFIGNKGTANSTTNRKTETKRLLTKGGAWDHSDGNRITTTGGDKIEIVQGNYKLIVLGRQNPTKSVTSPTTYASSATTSDQLETHRIYVSDISGGIDSTKSGGYNDLLDFDDYEFSKVYEWLSDEQAWATYEYSNKKRSYKETSGVDVSVFKGTRKETIVGVDPEKSWTMTTLVQDMVPTSSDPEVISKTWATTMESYTGSMEKPVPMSVSVSHVIAKNEFAFSAESYSVKWGAGHSTVVGGVHIGFKLGPVFTGFKFWGNYINIIRQNFLDTRLGTITSGGAFTSTKLIPKSDAVSAAQVDVTGAAVLTFLKESRGALKHFEGLSRDQLLTLLDQVDSVTSVEQFVQKFIG